MKSGLPNHLFSRSCWKTLQTVRSNTGPNQHSVPGHRKRQEYQEVANIVKSFLTNMKQKKLAHRKGITVFSCRANVGVCKGHRPQRG